MSTVDGISAHRVKNQRDVRRIRLRTGLSGTVETNDVSGHRSQASCGRRRTIPYLSDDRDTRQRACVRQAGEKNDIQKRRNARQRSCIEHPSQARTLKRSPTYRYQLAIW